MKVNKTAPRTYTISKEYTRETVYLDKLEKHKDAIVKFIAEKEADDTKSSIILALLEENKELRKGRSKSVKRTESDKKPNTYKHENIGKRIMKLLFLKQDKNGYVETNWGTKSPMGLSLSIERLIEEESEK